MANATTVLLVRFRTTLPEDEIRRIIAERSEEFRALTGLIQKYYIHDGETGEYGGLYLWDSPAALDDYRESALRASIAAAYRTEGPPRIDVLSIIETLRDKDQT